MKRIQILFVLALSLGLTSCGDNATPESQSQRKAANTDSSKVTASASQARNCSGERLELSEEDVVLALYNEPAEILVNLNFHADVLAGSDNAAVQTIIENTVCELVQNTHTEDISESGTTEFEVVLMNLTALDEYGDADINSMYQQASFTYRVSDGLTQIDKSVFSVDIEILANPIPEQDN